jgi:hypothetical protein
LCAGIDLFLPFFLDCVTFGGEICVKGGAMCFDFFNIYFGAVCDERLAHSGSMNHLLLAVLLKIKISL